MPRLSSILRSGALLAGSALLITCATNPATGKSEILLISESQEIQMGRESAVEANRSMGVYGDSGVQSYVSQLGKKLAATSERPALPWTFSVVDDPAVNAFALPGGFIFVTRGIMTDLNSEAELASVVGHEIGHVTARHSVRQISRQQMAQLGLGIGMIAVPKLQKLGDVLGTGLGLLFLKYGRDDEAQADELGFRYALRGGYDVRAMREVFVTLDGVTRASGGKVPEWQSTHPAPENRIKRTEERLAAVKDVDLSKQYLGRDEYLRRIDGMVYGVNPRDGFFEGSRFRHPDLRFEMDFPQGWATQNQAQGVIGVSPGQDAMVQLNLAQGTPADAARSFLSQQGMQAGDLSRADLNGLPAASAYFQAQSDQARLAGYVAFVSQSGSTFRILAYTTSDRFQGYDGALRSSAGSFRRLTDPAALSVQPKRVKLERVPRAMTLQQFAQQFPSTIPLGELALINRVDSAETLKAGQMVKRVVGK